MSYPGGPPPQAQPGPYPAPQPQFAPPAGQPQYPGGPQGQPQWGGVPPVPQQGPPQGQQFGAPPQQPGGPPPQFPSGPYAQPGAQPPMPVGPMGTYGGPVPNDPPGITVDCSYFPLAFLLMLTKPKIFVNGQQVPNTQWGPNHIPVGAGHYHLKVHTPWLIEMGPAEVPVALQDGQAVRYYYRTPVMIFLRGAIGPEPQKTPGMVAMYVLYGVVALFLLLNFLLLLVSAA